MELLQLQYFQQVAREENITRTANKLHVSQPSLSKTIRTLEKELGVLLFDRKGKRISLNENGKIFLRYVDIALLALSDANKEINLANSAALPDVRLNVAVHLDSLSQIICDFNQLYPNANFKLIKEPVTEFKPNHRYDLALITQSIEESLPDCSVSLLEEDLMLAVSAELPLAKMESVSLADLKNERFLCFQMSSPYRRIVDLYCNIAGFRPRVMVECHDWREMCELIRGQMGVGLVPKYSWRSCYEGLSIIPIHNPPCARRIIITWFDGKRLTESAKLFVDFAVDAVRNLEL